MYSYFRDTTLGVLLNGGSKTELRPLVRLDAIEHFTRTASRSRHAECGIAEQRRDRTVSRPVRARIRRIEQLKGHARAIVGHVEIDLHLVPGDRRGAAELQGRNCRNDGGDPFDGPPLQVILAIHLRARVQGVAFGDRYFDFL